MCLKFNWHYLFSECLLAAVVNHYPMFSWWLLFIVVNGDLGFYSIWLPRGFFPI